MAGTDLAKKLRILEGTQALALGAPEGFVTALQPLPAGARVVTERAGTHGVVVFFAGDAAALGAGLGAAIAATAPGGVLWVAYPKKSAGQGDLSRDRVWELVRPSGWGPVAQVALDETWSALRFKPEAEVKRGGRSAAG